MSEPVVTKWSNRTAVVWGGIAGVVTLALGTLMFTMLGGDGKNQEGEFVRPLKIKVKRAASGHSITLETDERLNYAGIRTPYKHEPFHNEARKRNSELVDGKKVRVRYDTPYRDRKGRLLGYVSVDGALVNETLVREGLAFVRLTTETTRFADRLLAAQVDARKHRRGVWHKMPKSSETNYPADPKYGNFHRPSCEEVAKINPERLIHFRSKWKAFDQGFAPCAKCLP